MAIELFAAATAADSTIDFVINKNDLPATLHTPDLSGAETIPIHRRTTGTTYKAMSRNGTTVKTSANHLEEQIFEVGHYRAVKPTTTSAVGVYLSTKRDP